jgi:ATP-binding cassette subfamily B protein RaxB
LFQREQTRQNQWQNFLAGSINKHIRIARWDISYNAINGVLWGTGNLFITYLAAKLVIDNSLSLGMLYAFLSFKGSFEGAMGGLISKWIEFKMLDLHLNRISDIAFTETEKIDLHENHDEVSGLNNNQSACVSYSPANRIGGKIEVRKLSYRYAEHEPYVFENLNFIIYPGETVAITGPSGCGKTTLMKCLMGLIEPTEGQILIDDIPLKSTRQYRSQIAAVMQEDQLLSGDVIENISCFSPVVDMERIFEVSKMACIHNEIMKMPMQYSTLVGDMGSNLSGGQKQRIILARALYRNPRILFMDEATSHLDIENEFNVNEHIKNLDISRVLIAHRPETVRSAGRRIKLTSHGEE